MTLELQLTEPPPVVVPAPAGETLVAMVSVQGAPASVTVKVWPAMVIVPVCELVLELAATE